MSKLMVHGLKLSKNAAETLQAAGVGGKQVTRDIAEVRDGQISDMHLRERCLKGAEGDDVIAGWNEYVDAVVAAAEEE
jgi:hypothetical protein